MISGKCLSARTSTSFGMEYLSIMQMVSVPSLLERMEEWAS